MAWCAAVGCLFGTIGIVAAFLPTPVSIGVPNAPGVSSRPEPTGIPSTGGAIPSLPSGLPSLPSDLPTDLPTSLPPDLPTDLPTSLPPGFPSLPGFPQGPR